MGKGTFNFKIYWSLDNFPLMVENIPQFLLGRDVLLPFFYQRSDVSVTLTPGGEVGVYWVHTGFRNREIQSVKKMQ